jgi:hypothetical protein
MLGAKNTRSAHAAPIDACGQSRTTTRSAASSTLSPRMSKWTSVSPAIAAGARASSSARRGRWWRDHESSASGGAASSRGQLQMSRARRSPAVRVRIGDGVSSAASSAIAASMRASSSSRHGSVGCVPAASSNTSTTQSPSSYIHRRRGTGAVAGSAPTMRASRR